MIRFNKYEHKKFLIFISDFIRKVSKGDRLTSISNKVGSLIQKEAKNKKKKLLFLILDVDQWKFQKKSSIRNL